VRLILPRGTHAVEFSRAFFRGTGTFARAFARFGRIRGPATRAVTDTILRPPFYALQPGVSKIQPNDTAALRQGVDQCMANAMADESVHGAVVPGFAVVCEMARA